MSSHHSPTSRFAAWTGAAALAFGSAAAHPANADPAPPFLNLVQQAQSQAPRLAVSEAEVGRVQGLRRQAGAMPNPTIGLEAENFAGTGPFRGLSQTETTLSVSQTVELGGKRSARIAAGDADVNAAILQSRQDRAQYIFDLAGRYVEADAADQRVRVAETTLALAVDDARAAEGLVKAGKEAELRSLTAQAAVAEARADLEAARASRSTALSALTALVGASTPITSLTESLLAHADRMEPAPIIDPLSVPAYIAAKAQRDAAVRRVRVEQTRAAPDVTVSLGVRRLNGADSANLTAAEAGVGRAATALVGGVSVPLPLFDQNKGNVAAAQAELRAADARLNQARLGAEDEVRSALAQIAASEAGVAAALQGQQAADEVSRRTRVGYEAGKLTLQELISARRAVAVANNQLLNARITRLTAEAALARLQGRIPFGDRP